MHRLTTVSLDPVAWGLGAIPGSLRGWVGDDHAAPRRGGIGHDEGGYQHVRPESVSPRGVFGQPQGGQSGSPQEAGDRGLGRRHLPQYGK